MSAATGPILSRFVPGVALKSHFNALWPHCEWVKKTLHNITWGPAVRHRIILHAHFSFAHGKTRDAYCFLGFSLIPVFQSLGAGVSSSFSHPSVFQLEVNVILKGAPQTSTFGLFLKDRIMRRSIYLHNVMCVSPVATKRHVHLSLSLSFSALGGWFRRGGESVLFLSPPTRSLSETRWGSGKCKLIGAGSCQS